MESFLRKALWLAISSLLIITGIVCILNPNITLASIAIFLGGTLLLSGVNNLFMYGEVYKQMEGSGWLLAEGILTIVLAFLCLFHQWVTVFTLPLIFSVWILFAGVSRLVNALDWKHVGLSSWWMIFLLGMVLLGFGVASMLKPVIAAITLSVLVGMILIFEGLDLLMKGFYFQKVARIVKQYLKGE